MRITVEVPDGEEAQFTQLMAEKGYAVVDDDDYIVPEWQKELVRRQRAESKPEDYIPLEDVLKSWGMED